MSIDSMNTVLPGTSTSVQPAMTYTMGRPGPTWSGVTCLPQGPPYWKLNRTRTLSVRKRRTPKQPTGPSKALKHHKRAVGLRSVRHQHLKEKAALLGPETTKKSVVANAEHVPFERPLISFLDGRRYQEILAQSVDEEKEEEGHTDQRLLNMMSGLQLSKADTASANHQPVTNAGPKATTQAFSFGKLMQELSLDTPRAAPVRTSNPAEPQRHHAVQPEAPFSKQDKTGMTRKPDAHRKETVQVGGSDSGNPLYHPDLSLGKGADYIHSVVDAAGDGCRDWLSRPAQEAHELERDTTSNPLRVMCRDLSHVKQLLQKGRQDWNLAHLPDDFLAHVQPTTHSLIGEVKTLAQHTGFDWLHGGANTALDVEVALAKIKAARLALWEESKKAYEEKQTKGSTAG